jgi:tRNA dimethylallyltransferase
MKDVIVIIGPTASGKTKLSVELAKDIGGEIISADSMQIYKYMDIGTAKPDKEEKAGIQHYLMDEVYPDEEFSVARFKALALQYIDLVHEKNKVPIIAGGTGLYVNSLIYNISFSETVSDWELRERLTKEAEEKGNEYIHNQLKQVDPEAAANIHPNNLKRVIRAIEVYTHTKKTISYHQEISRQEPPRHRFIVIGLRSERQSLYDRINQRVESMIEKGLIQEVENLIERGYDKSTVAMQGIGYKEILLYLRKEISFQETVESIKKGSRNYAKRQITWFKRIEDVFWIDVDELNDTGEILKKIKDYIASIGIIL